ncbi:MAG: alanine--tRNA ligase [Bdellovibrionaceae bacterium]|nr:alanine--tRNA ligase [Bdellovibrio sp.]
MKNSEIRNSFVDYFKKNNHTYVPSSSLIPENDPTLLFANAGMNQFKNSFLGLEKRDYNKAVSVQKCVRAGGKHNDLDNVGFTARHHTFFEMLGNFSFGDYFKKDAIHYAWEFLTKELKIPKEKLYVTVFETDDEAADLWHKQEGLPKDRIFRLGEKDNFWRMGDVGPCGPSSEIFYDHGAKAGNESDPYKGIISGEDRYVEIWNLVFMQFYEEAPGKMTPLPKPSVDTGAGFERVVAAIQGQFANYDTDLFLPMLDCASKLASRSYVSDPGILKNDPAVRERVAAMRVLADHCRSTSFLLADGALPSNEGRGYVLRRIMRRAIRYGRKLSIGHSFLPAMSEVLISQMGDVYPELKNRKDHIIATIKDEESRFLQTLDNGSAILNDELSALKKQNQKSVSGETLFKLYDTYGFPVDLTAVIAAEQGLQVDEAGFEKVMQASKEKAKSSWKGKSIQADEKHLLELTQKFSKTPTQFVGYESMTTATQITALSNGTAEVTSLKAGQSGFIILKDTAFYAEGGGQVGDQGTLKSKSGEARVLNTTKQSDLFIHHIEMLAGELKTGDTVETQVELSERRQTTTNHSATHLMHAALRKVLGTHVTQAGSLVDSSKTRFDFTHNKPMTSDEIKKVEALVNNEIAEAHPVQAEVMPHKQALEKGAMALFGEKYGDHVRVLTMGGFSSELCGGTHVKNTAEIRAFKIISESGVSAGVRRIEAITGQSAINYFLKNTDELLAARQSTGSTPDKPITAWIEEKKEEIKDLQKQIRKAQSGQINIDDIIKSAKDFTSLAGPAKLIFADLALDDRDVLSQISDQIKNKIPRGIVIVIGKNENSNPVIISVSKEMNSQFKAGDLLKDFAQILGGKGGGRPDFAQGSVPDRSKLSEAFEMISKKVLQ